MQPNQFIDRALGIPFAFGRGDWQGSDCWGLVELWYRELLGAELEDRQGHGFDHAGLQSGFDAATRWRPISEPSDNDLVVMRAGQFEAGHIGVHYQGFVLHTSERTGCVYQPLTDRLLRPRITGFLTYQ